MDAGVNRQFRESLAQSLALFRPGGIGVAPIGLQNSLAVIVESAPYAMALLDGDFRHLGASDNYCKTLHADRIGIVGKTHKELFSSAPEHWELAQKRCLLGESSRFEHDWTQSTIGIRRMSWHLYPWRKSRAKMGGAILFLQQVDSNQIEMPERLAYDVQFQHAEKMEAVCRLARRVADDLNNMLLVINGYSSMLAEELEGDQNLAKQAKAILCAGKRTAVLTGELLSLSRI
jgi:hypothetical protein